jgi:putative ABC transport system permease protein
MLKNYFKTAWRNLRKNKLHSFINIIGLSVGMAVSILIALWIWDELSFNKYHQNYDRIAQVMQNQTINGTVNTALAIPLPLETALRKTYGSDFKHIVTSFWTERHLLSAGDKKIFYPGTYMSDEAPEMFTLNMLKGTRNGLKDPSSIFISQSVATALFGNSDPMGKLVKLDNTADFKISGVYEDLPGNSSLREISFMAPWDYFVNSRDWVKRALDNWGENSFQMYVQVADNADMEKVSEKIKNIILSKVNIEDAKSKPVILLHPMSKWHLYAEFKNGANTGGAIEYVWLFGIIGIFVLLLACINFMNLSTARSEKRAREVGIRKSIGSRRFQLISQFYCESLLIAVCAFGFSLLLVLLVLPFFNEVADKKMSVPWADPFFWILGAGFTLFTGFIAGSYPALYLSAFKPVKVLKGTFKAGRFAAIPRKALVVAQFTVSVVLIIGTIIVFKQIQFAKNRRVGYNRNGLVYIETQTDDLQAHFDAIKTDLLRSGAITEMAGSLSPITGLHNSKSDLEWKEKDPAASYNFGSIRITSGYGQTVSWQLTEGRDFSSQLLTDSSALILNEAAVKYMGLKNPLGEIIRFGHNEYKVIGVVKDMVMQSPYEPVKPTIFYMASGDVPDILMKINPNVSAHDAISKIAAVCKVYSPSVPFSYKFADEEYAKKFNDEERIGKLASFFTILAIFISCLGLFGMATFMAEQRTKEIGVRKVLGATVFNLWRLLSRDFIVLIIISLFIAIPAAYYFMGNWLLHYEYRSDMPWWVFAAAGIGAIIITLLTVSYQSIKAALANPVKSLKTE